MGFLSLLYTASVPVLEILIVTALGAFIATDFIGLFNEEARNYINHIVFYVLTPALVGGNLADTVTATSLAEMWFMPINTFLTFLFGSALGWILIKLTKAPPHLRALILGVCSAGNLGNLLLVIVPAICDESDNPFGDSSTCSTNGLAYATFSMALGAIFIWSYVYNVMRISARNVLADANALDQLESSGDTTEVLPDSNTEPLLPCISDANEKDPFHVKFIGSKCIQWLKKFAQKINLKHILTPSTCATIVGFFIGVVSPIQKLIIGDSAPLRVIKSSTTLVGQAAIPIITLIIGGNLLNGFKREGMKKMIIVGVMVVRYILLPMIGIGVVKAAHQFGFVKSNPLYQFVLMLQFALPPATSIGVMTQLFRAGEAECSVIMLWTYIFAAFAITLWATIYLIIVS